MVIYFCRTLLSDILIFIYDDQKINAVKCNNFNIH